MHIDISRTRFDATKSYSGVVALQGRVALDSDQNELQAIWRHQVRTALTDVIGQAGAPRDHAGFAVGLAGQSPDKLADLTVSAGRMYVDGILTENPADTTYWEQPFGHLDPDVDRLSTDGYVVYLRLWEREATVVQDDDLREVALGIHGPDTTARSQVVWQVAALPVGGNVESATKAWQEALDTRLLASRGQARARARTPDDADQDVCSVSPEAMFRGQENQLYRVEIFRSGVAGSGDLNANGGATVKGTNGTVKAGAKGAAKKTGQSAEAGSLPAQFVWSRDNGSYVYPISRLAGAEVTVADLGRDLRSALDVGDLVEIVDDGSMDRIGRDPGVSVERFVYTVTEVDTLRRTALLDRDPAVETGEVGHDPDLHPLLRRWDAGPVSVQEGSWLPLEDGVEIQFAEPSDTQQPYRTGDHWLIPARRTTGDVIWPQDPDGPAFRPADGIDYHYAALAHVPAAANGKITDLRVLFNPLAG